MNVAEQSIKQTIQSLTQALKEAGISTVSASYDGSFDNGIIICYDGKTDTPPQLKEMQLSYQMPQQAYEGNEIVYRPQPAVGDFDSALIDLLDMVTALSIEDEDASCDACLTLTSNGGCVLKLDNYVQSKEHSEHSFSSL